MSSEYTIDIQLTELGFPDILQPSEPPVKETPCPLASSYASFPRSHPPTPLSTTPTEGQLIGGRQSVVENPPAAAVTQDLNIQQSTMGSGLKPTKTLRCILPRPTQSQEDKQVARVGAVDAVEGTVLPPLLVSVLSSTTGVGITVIPKLTTQHKIGEADTENGDVDEDQDVKGNSTKEKQGVENESDDSEVSEMDEEEEDDDDEEEGLDIESSLSGDYRCGVCDLQLPSNIKLQEHMNLHTGARPYCCAECGKRFCQIKNYRAHLRTHAQSKVDPLLCRICLKVFKSKEDLKDHQSTTHFEKEFYECDLCKRVFTDLKVCEWHVEWHKHTLGNFVCETCGRIFSHQRSLTRHRYKKCHRSYSCTDCTRTFSRKNALLKHSFSHLGLLPYTCIRCRCHFRLAKLYRLHKCEPQRIHCVACLRVFISQEDFQKHKKDTGCWGHQEPKGDEIRCLECGQRFATVEELKKHAGAHQRVLCCAECGKGFRSALLLMSHMGGHAGQSPCLCQSCGMGFPHQQSYDSHLKNCGHTPSPVSAPKKRPASKSSLPPVKPMAQLDAKLPLPTKTPTNASNPAKRTVTTPAAISKIPAAQVEDSGSPGGMTGGVLSRSNSAEGVWQLTLDKQPPAGVNLVLFVPVNSSLANGLTFPPTIPETLSVPDIQVQRHVALPPASSCEPGLHKASSCLGMTSVLGAPLHLDVPLDLVMGNKHEPDCAAPLDLSKKSTSTKPALIFRPPLPVKTEPEDPEFSEVAGNMEGEAFQSVDNKDAILNTKRGQGLNTAERDRHTAVKHLKTDPMDLSPVNFSATSSGLVMDIKREPQSLGPDGHLLPSNSCQLTAWRPEKEMKMEVDGPSPVCADGHVDPE